MRVRRPATTGGGTCAQPLLVALPAPRVQRCAGVSGCVHRAFMARSLAASGAALIAQHRGDRRAEALLDLRIDGGILAA